MRLILHNPHTEVHFGVTVLNAITKSPSFRKYKYLLDYLRNDKKSYAIYIDRVGSSFPPYMARYVPKHIEIFLWFLVNRINPLRVKLITDIDKLKDDDVFLSFAYANLDGQNSGINNIAKKKFPKIFHATHFIMRTSAIAKNAKKLEIDYFVAENNLAKHSKFFKRYFPFYKNDVYFLPYVFQERFKKIKSFKSRKNACLATGTIIKISEMVNPEEAFKDFLDFYKVDTIHPIRMVIYNNKKKLQGLIDSYIAYLWDAKRMTVSPKENIIKKLYSKFFNAFVLAKRDYFKFNIAEKYNEYKMFIVPEEINNLPGVGFVEGMACGAAYIGKIDPMYSDLGLKPGVHYVGYNGTIADLKKKIIYFQKHPKELEKIADNGYKFVTENFNAHRVAETFFKDIEEYVKQRKKDSKKSRLVSSFIKQ